MKIICISIPIIGHLVVVMSQDSNIALLKYGGDGIVVASFLQKINCFGMRCLLEDGLAAVYKPLAMEHLDRMTSSVFTIKIPNLAKPLVKIRKDRGRDEKKGDYHQRFPYLLTVWEAVEVFVCSPPSGSTITMSPTYTNAEKVQNKIA